jgi:S-adenosylmethionine-diacylglycerol 3-amino-3-carboxypropyl transferase
MTGGEARRATEIASRSSFAMLRYAQCWEDADVLLEALQPGPRDVCLSVMSAGDNSLSLLSTLPAHVVAVDISPGQVACLELRVAALRELDYDELLRLIGSRPGRDRAALYRRCRALLSSDGRAFWDRRPGDIERGIGDAGKFEGYFRLFRRAVLPLVHTHREVEALVAPRSPEERREFYYSRWNNRRWRWMFAMFFSRFVMGRLGRDPGFFRYVQGSVADRILDRARHALAELDPAQNPYVQWILFGEHRTALPHWLRPDSVERMRGHLDHLEWRQQSIESFLASNDARRVTRLNLSDIFEYMSPQSHENVLRLIAKTVPPRARLAYWNLLAPRARPEALAQQIGALQGLSDELHLRDKAFFYHAFVVEETIAS